MTQPEMLAPCPCGRAATFLPDDSYGSCHAGCNCEAEPYIIRPIGHDAECIAAWNAFAARPTAGIDRATLAQIIDPKAWETRARHLDDTDWEKNHPSMRIAVSMRQAGAVIADEVVARSLAKADAILALLPAPAKTGERGAVIEECAIAARNAMVDMEWPPQDGDREIDEVLAAIRALSQPLPDDGGPK